MQNFCVSELNMVSFFDILYPTLFVKGAKGAATQFWQQFQKCVLWKPSVPEGSADLVTVSERKACSGILFNGLQFIVFPHLVFSFSDLKSVVSVFISLLLTFSSVQCLNALLPKGNLKWAFTVLYGFCTTFRKIMVCMGNHICLTICVCQLEKYWTDSDVISCYAIRVHLKFIHFNFVHPVIAAWQMHRVMSLQWHYCNYQNVIVGLTVVIMGIVVMMVTIGMNFGVS
jgi:hypothetical protein